MNFKKENYLEPPVEKKFDPDAIEEQILKYLDKGKELFETLDFGAMKNEDLIALKNKMVNYIDVCEDCILVDREALHKRDEKVGKSYDMFKYNTATLKYRHLNKLVEEIKKRGLEVEDDILDGAEEEYNETSKLVSEFLNSDEENTEGK